MGYPDFFQPILEQIHDIQNHQAFAQSNFFGLSIQSKSNTKICLKIQIQNPILILDCQSQSNQPNWIAIWIEQSSNPIQQYPENHHVKNDG